MQGFGLRGLVGFRSWGLAFRAKAGQSEHSDGSGLRLRHTSASRNPKLKLFITEDSSSFRNGPRRDWKESVM